MRELTWCNDVSVEMPAKCIASSSKLDLRMKLLLLEILSLSMSIFTHLTPELSRPAAGWRTRASVAQARGRRHDVGSA